MNVINNCQEAKEEKDKLRLSKTRVTFKITTRSKSSEIQFN